MSVSGPTKNPPENTSEDASDRKTHGKPLAYWSVAALFRRFFKRTGIDGKRVSAHNCRLYTTTQLVDGRSLLDVQRQMGHRNLTMTNKYASLRVQHLKKSHEKHLDIGHSFWLFGWVKKDVDFLVAIISCT